MKYEETYSNYNRISYCHHCGWYEQKNSIFNNVFGCCPDCGEEINMESGRYLMKVANPENFFEELLRFFGFFPTKIKGFKLKGD